MSSSMKSGESRSLKNSFKSGTSSRRDKKDDSRGKKSKDHKRSRSPKESPRTIDEGSSKSPRSKKDRDSKKDKSRERDNDGKYRPIPNEEERNYMRFFEQNFTPLLNRLKLDVVDKKPKANQLVDLYLQRLNFAVTGYAKKEEEKMMTGRAGIWSR